MSENRGPVVALVPAAGRGVRLGESVPKAFVELGGRSMLRRAVDGLLESGAVDTVVVIVPEDLIDTARARLPDGVVVVAGGEERADSVRAGLSVVDGAEFVLVHDAARALTPPSLIARVVAELQAGRTAVIPVLPVSDTIKTVDVLGAVTGTPLRSELRAVQTPQGFTTELLRRAYRDVNGDATDDAGLVERLGERVRTIVGEPEAFKITTPWDLTLARVLLGRSGSEQGS
ncbi:2-C-methyl-D-erythritol 4-phosphate cytidylyltransferase [Rhodococcus sp. ABRD24]|uniref:2-C-methyl-D-erythritol 4-phosphate cytidylyltransferase n=1 Tax=Rhodococcus sp. ABRD24 TaxID=2507582 RepID=UPI00103D4525|nr:2-C-methyl-D-erythritol 4-phosphate cytidylyltransferase [Rhodococcus sp. ABRD24]QBJ97080.1 2-C-methyl-D-erythritol 4-phosphate cytidylyltransferase [Rhodococcus sp. ABRD24]